MAFFSIVQFPSLCPCFALYEIYYSLVGIMLAITALSMVQIQVLLAWLCVRL